MNVKDEFSQLKRHKQIFQFLKVERSRWSENPVNLGKSDELAAFIESSQSCTFIFESISSKFGLIWSSTELFSLHPTCSIRPAAYRVHSLGKINILTQKLDYVGNFYRICIEIGSQLFINTEKCDNNLNVTIFLKRVD